MNGNLIQNAINAMPAFISVFENKRSTKEEVKDAARGVSNLLKMIVGRNIEHMEFNAIYGKNDPNRNEMLEKKSKEILKKLIDMEN